MINPNTDVVTGELGRLYRAFCPRYSMTLYRRRYMLMVAISCPFGLRVLCSKNYQISYRVPSDRYPTWLSSDTRR
jgi:hypothetical protein